MLDWPLRLEKRPRPSATMRIAAPAVATVLMLLTGYIAFALLGKEPIAALHSYFLSPISSAYGVGELLLKATPLMMCALGLAIGFKANVWNIGAEGQFTLGAISGSGVALFWGNTLGSLTIPAMLIAGALGGAAWAAIPALLRSRFHTSEILVSLMLVYIAQLFLSWIVRVPWRDPTGFNFPQSKVFDDAVVLPTLFEGGRTTIAFPVALCLAAGAWFFLSRTFAGYRMQVAGLAPAAASYAGFSEKRNIWLALLVGGATAGLAGICEVAGPIGRLQPSISPGYGFAAIIVAFIGRLHPVGIVLASLLLSLLYLGGESVQLELQLPSAVSGLFQGTLLFYLLGAELFVAYRLRRVQREAASDVIGEAVQTP
ncbi:MAG: ral nucleoside transport system permease protein [Gammaproteobacteria bacterium]|nr:ral nucleoside transport system permease protein [Gammaproteobacteria bacterium]